MSIDDVVDSVATGQVIRIDRRDLAPLIEKARIIREDATGIAGRIRTLLLGDRVLVQERNPEGDLFLRGLPSVKCAAAFVEARLAAYERMWDG